MSGPNSPKPRYTSGSTRHIRANGSARSLSPEPNRHAASPDLPGTPLGTSVHEIQAFLAQKARLSPSGSSDADSSPGAPTFNQSHRFSHNRSPGSTGTHWSFMTSDGSIAPFGEPQKMTGYLMKEDHEGKLFGKAWKKRWFGLEDSLLKFGKGPDDKEFKEIPMINIKSVTMIEMHRGKHEFEVATNLFQDNNKPRSYFLAASSEEEAKTWVTNIGNNMIMARGRAARPSSTASRKEPFHQPTSNAGGGRKRRVSISDALKPTTFVKALVSKKKKRYQEDGFDLDLSYINTQLIAMGFPSEGVEGVYRNPMSEVYRFFETKHPDCYLVYNLCTERSYDSEKFHHRVEEWPFDDHSPPPFEMMRPLCNNIREWLENPNNVAAIHCKAGKGRTGTIIATYLLHIGACETAEEAMQLFAEQRTHNGKGVTIPSQRRYIKYFEQNLGKSRPLRAIQLNTISILYCPPAMTSGLTITVENGQVRETIPYIEKEHAGTSVIAVEMGDIEVAGDVRLSVFRHVTGLLSESDNKICSFWFHTSFVEDDQLIVHKKELDGAPRKDKTDEKFHADFAIKLDCTTSSLEVFRIHHPESGITGLANATTHLSKMDLTVTEESFTNALDSAMEARAQSITPAAICGAESLPKSSPLMRCASGLAIKHSGLTLNTPVTSLERGFSIPEELSVDEDLQSEANGVASYEKRGSDAAVSSKGSLGSFSRQLSVASPADSSQLPSIGEGIMLYDFQPSEEESSGENKGKYLCLRANDVVKIVKKDSKGWWLGEFCNQKGWFPARYCVEIVDKH